MNPIRIASFSHCLAFPLSLSLGIFGVFSPVWEANCQNWNYSIQVDEEDLKFPLKDLEEIPGEVVWIQGAVLRGDPRVYRNPHGPVAAYEQGLLDEEGMVWTFLDTPHGRELRYNPELRGQQVEIRGWAYPQTRIIEVHSWQDSNRHPVRVREDFPEPEKIPFDPTKAERIETIRPAAPSKISPDLLDRGMWEIQEGMRIDTTGEALPTPIPLSPGAEELNRLLEEDPPADREPPDQEPPNVAPQPLPEALPPSLPGQTNVTPPPPPPGRGLPPSPQPRILNPEGQPLASPEEFDAALQKALLE
jgi:hypothetical protein